MALQKSFFQFIGITAVLSFAGSFAIAQESQATSLQEAAQHALNTNPEVQAAWNAFLAAEHEQKVAWGGFLPSVDVEARIGHERQEFHDSSTTLNFDRRGIALSVTQMLYDGFATRSEFRRLGHARLTRYFEVRDAAEKVVLETYRAYQDVQRYRELVDLARDNLIYHRDIYQQINERVGAGISRSVDFEQATGRLALAESNLITEFSNLHDVSARYQRIVGEPPAAELSAAPGFEGELPDSVRDSLLSAYSRNPAIRAAVANIEASRSSIAGARSRMHPRVDLRLRGEYGEDIDRVNGRTSDQIAELVVSYNLFRGGSDRAAIAQALDATQVAEDLRIKTCRDVRQTLRIAYNDTQRLSQQLVYLSLHKLSIDKAREAYRSQFGIGQRTLLDLLDTENEYFEARRAHTIADFDHKIAGARTLAEMGQLMQVLEISRADMKTMADDAESGVLTVCPPDPEPGLLAADWLDSDGDGVPDRSDACPGTPLGTPVNAVGCRKIVLADSDGDGITDDADLCPGTPAGAQVNNVGCALKQHVVMDGVSFKVYSATLTLQAEEALDDAAQILLTSPGMRVEIAGHTDTSGSSELNIRLSQQRAESVMRYLAKRGVRIDQMVAKGYGPAQPLASNDTPQGRAQNRRVEFRILRR